MRKPKARRASKEIRLQQLRSFCETARLGSLGAAATSLGLSQPTVWEQVHALEREFGTQLIESHRRGCRLTETGRLLAELALPLVTGADTLKQSFEEKRGAVEGRLTVAAPQRILVEDMHEVINRFRELYPRVRLRLVERVTGQVADAVESGEADLGVSTDREPSLASPWLRAEHAYYHDVLLVTQSDHPLARKKKLEPKDLVGHALVNAPEGFTRPEIAADLRQLGVFDDPPRPVEALTTAVIRHFVERGFGIGLVLGRLGAAPGGLHERSMSDHFGKASICVIWRKGMRPSEHALAFAELV
ncbi:MAG: LysR family transcriptional regulator, partial [Gemmataceae bacterium]